MKIITIEERANIDRFVATLYGESTLRALLALGTLDQLAKDAVEAQEGEDEVLDFLRGPFEGRLDLVRSLGWEDAETWWQDHGDLRLRFGLTGGSVEVSAEVDGQWYALYPGVVVPASDYPALLAAYAATL